MKRDIGRPSRLRWRLAAACGPETIALGLVVVLAIAVLTIIWLGSH